MFLLQVLYCVHVTVHNERTHAHTRAHTSIHAHINTNNIAPKFIYIRVLFTWKFIFCFSDIHMGFIVYVPVILWSIPSVPQSTLYSTF